MESLLFFVFLNANVNKVQRIDLKVQDNQMLSGYVFTVTNHKKGEL